MTQDELATLARIFRDHDFTFEQIRQAMADLYGGMDEPTRGWVCHLLRSLDSGRYQPAMTDDVRAFSARVMGTDVRETVETAAVPLTEVAITPLLKVVPQRQLLKAVVFDIETTDFSATGYDGYLVCCSFLPLDAEKPYTLSLAFDDLDDRRLMAAVVAELSKYDILIGHYITGFDLTWLYTRNDIHGFPPLRRWLTFDTYYAARSQRLKVDRKSLAFLIDHFGLEGTKTAIYPRHWNNIRSRRIEEFEDARSTIVEHCEFDVIANRHLFDRLLPKAWSVAASPFKVTFWAGASAVEDAA